MIYLDYSATTFPNKSVLTTFVDASLNYKGNPNSTHNLGLNAKKKIDDVIKSISGISFT
jgi:cysteine desulfurase